MISIFLLTSVLVCLIGLQAVIGQNDRESLEYRLQVEYDKLMEAQKNAEQFTVKSGSIYVAGRYGTEWLLRAISAKSREKWADRWTVTGDARRIFDKELDKLSGIAAKKIPGFKPGAQYFAFHGKEEESRMKEEFDHPDQMKIHKIGLFTDNWKQEGTSEPTRIGYIWARDLTDDHPYCHLYMFSLTISTFGTEKLCRASLYEDSIIGCP